LNGSATTYTLDLNTRLTQALVDGTNTYTYGLNRINQVSDTQTGYFLTDALGSVRQVLSQEDEVLLAREYSPRELCAPERSLRVGLERLFPASVTMKLTIHIPAR
jgi:hypothetical protein